MHLNHDFYVVVGKQCRTENVYTGHQYNIFILYELTNVLLLFICFKLVLSYYKDIVLVTRRTHIMYGIVTNNNIKVVIQMHTFLFDQNILCDILLSFDLSEMIFNGSKSSININKVIHPFKK